MQMATAASTDVTLRIIAEVTMENGELQAALAYKNLQIEKLEAKIADLEDKLIEQTKRNKYYTRRYRQLQEKSNAQR